tara:strand:- start:44787 stop:46415 length:1629 start_codon:yes stop_codon:yes gene_type:complete
MSNKSLLEEALIEAQQIEETVKSNAKEILASTMKEEIEELVKESLSNNGLKKKVIKEQELEAMVDDDEEVIDMDDEGGDDEMEDVLAMADEVDVDDIPSPEGEEEFEPLDLTQASDEDVLKVFKAMGAEDGVIVKQDDDVISIEDEGTGEEYRIELDESKKRKSIIKEDDMEDEMDVNVEDEEVQSLEEDDYSDDRWSGHYKDAAEDDYSQIEKLKKDAHYDAGRRRANMDEMMGDEPMYEIEMDDMQEGGSKMGDQSASHLDYEKDMHERGSKMGDQSATHLDYEQDMKEGGAKMGDQSATHLDYEKDMKEGGAKKGDQSKSHLDYEGKKEDMEEMVRINNLGQKVHAGNRSNKYNKAAREKAGINMKESRRSVRNRFINERKRMEDTKVLTENIDNLKGEVKILKNKNGEYKKALKMFRDKLNEVAVFNSNLAYATKLFTEHTTNKSEKINILRRFDEVESLKESKALYKNMKKQLSSSTKSVVKESLGNKNSKKTVQLSESVQKKITKTPVTGASKLRESRTYVDPQIARSLDIMSKIK